MAPVLASSEGAAEGPPGWLVAARSGQTTPSGWPADLGLQADGLDGSGPAPTGRVAAPVGTAPGTARDTDRPDRSCRWRPLASAPASPTTQPRWPPVAAGRPPGSPQDAQVRDGAAPAPAPGSPPDPLSVAAAPAVRLLGWLAGRAHPPSGGNPSAGFSCLQRTHSRTAWFCPPAFPSPHAAYRQPASDRAAWRRGSVDDTCTCTAGPGLVDPAVQESAWPSNDGRPRPGCVRTTWTAVSSRPSR